MTAHDPRGGPQTGTEDRCRRRLRRSPRPRHRPRRRRSPPRLPLHGHRRRDPDASRSGTPVVFVVAAGHLGRDEARDIRPRAAFDGRTAATRQGLHGRPLPGRERGRPPRPPSGGLADLHEGQPDLRQSVLERRFGVTEPAGQALDDGGHGVDGQAGGGEVGLLRQMDSSQFEEPVGVVGHHHVGRRVHQLAPELVELGGQRLALLGLEVVEVVGEVVGPGRRAGRAAGGPPAPPVRSGGARRRARSSPRAARGALPQVSRGCSRLVA